MTSVAAALRRLDYDSQQVVRGQAVLGPARAPRGAPNLETKVVAEALG